jgi:hypothetical protein
VADCRDHQLAALTWPSPAHEPTGIANGQPSGLVAAEVKTAPNTVMAQGRSFTTQLAAWVHVFRFDGSMIAEQ